MPDIEPAQDPVETVDVDKDSDGSLSSSQAAATLVAANLVMKAGTHILRGVIERTILHGRFGDNAAERILANKRVKGSALASTAARFATKSKPGAAIVGAGIATKLLFDLSQSRRQRLGKGKAPLESSNED